jgi:hypothetical protein
MAGFANLATWDRVLRIVVGGAMLVAGWAGMVPGVWGIALRVFAWVPLATALLGWCPVYALLGISTRSQRSAPRDR